MEPQVIKDGFVISDFDSNDFKTAKAQFLHQLLDEGKAFKKENNVIIPHKVVSSLSREYLSILDFPDFYPYGIEIKASGTITDKNFKYLYYFINPNNERFVNPKVIGAYIKISDEQKYILPKDIYLIKKEVDNFNSQPQDKKQIKNNYIKFSKIKELSKKVGALLDEYLESEEVIVSNKLTVILKQTENDTVEFIPVVCKEEIDENGEKMLVPLTDGEFLDKFDKIKKVRSIYPTKKRVIFTDTQVKELKKIKSIRKVSKNEAKKLITKLPEYLNQNVIDLDTPILINGEKFCWSERVIGIGEYNLKPVTSSNIREIWIPIEEPDSKSPIIIIEFMNGKKLEFTKSELKILENDIEKAKKENLESISTKDDTEIKRKEFNNILDIIKKVKGIKKTQIRKIILHIKDNINEKEFNATIEQRKEDIFIPENHLKDNVKLLQHQLEGIEKMQGLYINGYHGVLLADDMGLGKTLQTLVFLAWLTELEKKYKKSIEPILIVAPVSLIENWKTEYEKFLKPLWGDFIEIHGANLKKFKNKQNDIIEKKETELSEEVVKKLLEKDEYFLLDLSKIENNSVAITTYETLRNYQFSFAKKDWSVVIVDEAQKMKNPTSMISNSLKSLKYNFAIAITGTPVENSWIDLWNLMDFIQPGYLDSLSDFNRKYVLPLKNEKTNVLEKGNDLLKKIKIFLIRRMKEDILEDLP
jgi:SNF2 family DNA or RNA helicase